MKDFAEWCQQKGFAQIQEDGTVQWSEGLKPPTSGTHKDATKGGKKIHHSDKKSSGVRDGRDDLSSDYKGNYNHMGTVWPFKVVAKGSGKAVAPVAG